VASEQLNGQNVYVNPAGYLIEYDARNQVWYIGTYWDEGSDNAPLANGHDATGGDWYSQAEGFTGGSTAWA
jgi:hypothetical protein